MKNKIGLTFIVFGFFLPILGLIVPFLGLSAQNSAMLIGFFMLGGPEIFIVLGGILAGKEGLEMVQNKVKSILGLPQGKYMAPRAQYRLALLFIFIWFIGAISVGYIPDLFEWEWYRENVLFLSIGFDIMLIVAIFFIGGKQMTSKISALLHWEEWPLEN